MKPLVHIGYPKTATTWFRTRFYPMVRDAFFVDRKTINPIIVKTDLANFNKSIIIEKLQIPKSNQLILCSETLMGHISDGSTNWKYSKENAIKLKELFPDSNIVIFIRNQQELITSAYIQYIKNGGNYSINKYLYSNENLFRFDHLEFDKKLAHYIQIFGRENIHIYVYEDFIKDRKAFLEKYIAKFQLEINFKNLNLVQVNSRIKSNFIPLKRFANCFIKKNSIKFKHRLFYIPLVNRMVDFYIKQTSNTFLAGEIATSEKILGAKNIAYIKNYYAQSNLNLIKIIDVEQLKQYKYLS
ncbi:MAG TPA: hypothetical protein DDX39_09170 [Bacteroidales bacterium]|nr:MAG: hypothetical protein A2W98_15075 [Bacteroidetes bacterium GWF2_33_38]HBF88799.1 hypothetical protein [Bacteroidales bacterium]